jgi:hypothetical protein
MSAENAPWSLLHIESKLQVDSLSIRHARALVQSFDETEFTKWAGWYEGLPDWLLIEDLLQTLGVIRKPKAPPPVTAAPPPPPKPPPFTGAHSNTPPSLSIPVAEPAMPEIAAVPSTLNLPIEHATTQTATGMLNPDGRLSKRVNKRYKVYVGTRGKMHESVTVDLSLTGLQMIDGIPAGNEGNLEVALVNSKGETLSLICSVISDERRNRMKIVRVGKLDQLQLWLTSAGD